MPAGCALHAHGVQCMHVGAVHARGVQCMRKVYIGNVEQDFMLQNCMVHALHHRACNA